MPDQTVAAQLPGGSVVVDDLKGVAFYAVGNPGEEYRWWETTTERADSTVDYALRHGAQVVRVGDNLPAAAPPVANDNLTAPERAALEAWQRVSADTTGMLYAVRAALAAERQHAERRAARVEAARSILATDVGPDVRQYLTPVAAGYAPDARERLARHLFLSERTDEWAPREWDLPQHVNQEPYLRRADALLAVITGKDSR